MKIHKHWPLYLLLIAVAVLGTRLAWRLTFSETGLMPHLEQWVNVAASLVGVERPALGDRDPAQQAMFWLAEVERIKPTEDDPQVAMGAAWMLDAPQFGFIRRHVRMQSGMDFPGIPASRRRELDHETIAVLIEEFESRCREKCLAQIELAVRLDNTNVELRRAYALLLFQPKSMRFDSKPRREDWLAILDECAQVDPDNALYDYLAASYLWTSSAALDSDEDGWFLNIENEATFEQGKSRLVAGVGKPHLKFGIEGYAATIAFLNESSISLSDHLHAAGSRQIDDRAWNLLHRIRRWQSVQVDVEKRADRLDSAVAAVRYVRAISDQISTADNYLNLLSPRLQLRQWSLENLKGMHKDHSNLLSVDEAAKVSTELADVQLEVKVLGEVSRRMTAKAGTTANTQVSSDTSATVAEDMLAVFLMASSQMLVILTVALAVISSLIAWLFGRAGNDRQAAVGWLRHIAAWIFAVGISFILLGMFPAEIVSAIFQSWLVCGDIWIGFASLVLGLLYLFGRRFELSGSQVAVLVTVTALPMIALGHPEATINLVVAGTAKLHPVFSIVSLLLLASILWATFRFLWKLAHNDNVTRRRKFLAVGVVFLIALVAVPAGTALEMMTDEFETRGWISPTVWERAKGLHIGADELQSAMKLEDSSWTWAFIQWQAHDGPVVAPLMAVVILLAWHVIRQSRQVEGGLRQIFRSGKRRAIRLTGMSVAGSCSVASIFFLLLYLGTTPTVADMMNTFHRVHYERLARPSLAWEEIAETTVLVKSDEKTMSKLQAEIDERNRELAEQEAWEDEHNRKLAEQEAREDEQE
jgi:hypothetical protein